MKTILYEKDTLEEGILLCFTNKLFVPHWSAEGLFEDFLNGDRQAEFKLLVAFEKEIPIAWCLKFVNGEHSCYTTKDVCWRFTLPSWRYQGIARKLWVEIGKGKTLGDHKFYDN